MNRTAQEGGESEAARLPASGLTTQQRGIGSGQVAVPVAGRGASVLGRWPYLRRQRTSCQLCVNHSHGVELL